MRIALDYGKTGLQVDIPDQNLVGPLAIQPISPLADPVSALSAALARPVASAPLEELARGKRSACVLICDVTRPVPNELLLGEILPALERGGVPHDQTLILIATGLHRPNLGAELENWSGTRSPTATGWRTTTAGNSHSTPIWGSRRAASPPGSTAATCRPS